MIVGMAGHPAARDLSFTHTLNFTKPVTKKHYEIDVVTGRRPKRQVRNHECVRDGPRARGGNFCGCESQSCMLGCL